MKKLFTIMLPVLLVVFGQTVWAEEDLEIVKLNPVILDLPYYGDDEDIYWDDDD